MENGKDTFTYTYSAKQQQEIRNIREKYLPKEDKEDKMERLRRLDRKSTKKGAAVSLAAGIAGCLLLGVGMWRALYPRRGRRAGRDCRRGGGVPAVFPHHPKGTGKAGPANPEAGGRTLQTGIRKQTGQGFSSPVRSVFLFRRLPDGCQTMLTGDGSARASAGFFRLPGRPSPTRRCRCRTRRPPPSPPARRLWRRRAWTVRCRAGPPL